MLIINGGIPRSGTVLVGNLIRLMLERRGIAWLRYNPQERRHLPEFLEVARRVPPDPAVIVHTHLIDADVLSALGRRDDAVLVWNHRDPRDALVSLVKLHDLTLAHGLRAMRAYCSAAELAVAHPGCLEIRYAELMSDLARHVERLASALSFTLQAGEVEELIAATSVSAHRQVMTALRDGAVPDMAEHQTRTRVLREDPRTLLNDRHIQSGKRGRWRTELAGAVQPEIAKELAPWITRFGDVE